MGIAAMVTGYGRKSSWSLCWGLILLHVLQVEPVRLEILSAATKTASNQIKDPATTTPSVLRYDINKIIQWGRQTDSHLWCKHWHPYGSALRGLWWYCVVSVACNNDAACFILVKTPRPAKSFMTKIGSQRAMEVFVGYVDKGTPDKLLNAFVEALRAGESWGDGSSTKSDAMENVFKSVFFPKISEAKKFGNNALNLGDVKARNRQSDLYTHVTNWVKRVMAKYYAIAEMPVDMGPLGVDPRQLTTSAIAEKRTKTTDDLRTPY